MVVTPSGIVTLTTCEPRKARGPIVEIPAGMVTLEALPVYFTRTLPTSSNPSMMLVILQRSNALLTVPPGVINNSNVMALQFLLRCILRIYENKESVYWDSERRKMKAKLTKLKINIHRRSVMSIEATTYEQINVKNNNEQTKAVAEKIGEYMLETWGILNLKMTVDGKAFETDEESITEDSEFYEVCKNLDSAKNFEISLRSCNAGGLAWRKESAFVSMLTDDESLTKNISYKSIDYYDTDSFVDACVFDENGLKCASKFDDAFETVADIKEWYSYSPEIHITSEGMNDNTQLHEAVLKNLTEILTSVCEYDEDELDFRLEDDWEDYGEMMIEGSLCFPSSKIKELKSCCENITREVNKYDSAKVELSINAVPNGEDDYDFAVLSIELKDGSVQVSALRI